MRTSKIAALVAATALLVVGSAIAAMAATTGWVEESGSWKYYKNGEAQTECFAKSGDNWYWLDENGEMATDKLVNYNDSYYYVDANGVMVKNTWKDIPNTSDDSWADTIWYYFQNNGKAYLAGTSSTPAWKTINGKKYTFDSEGKMKYGWLTSTGEMIDDSENNAYKKANDGTYYCGDSNDGARVTSAWAKLYIVSGDSDELDGDYWFYFDAAGKKVATNKAKTINGKKYAFNDDGVMLAEWVNVTSPASTATGTAAPYAWFQDAETGAKYANGWFKVVPTASMNSTDHSNEDTHWYYADSKGVLAQSTIKTIKSKQYAFNDAGEMQSGLLWSEYDAASNTFKFTTIADGNDSTINVEYVIDPTNTTYKDAGVNKSGLRFFSDDADNDGSMKTGTVKTTVNGDEYSFKLGTKGTNKGVGFTGKDGSYFYQNGYKLAADAEYKIGLMTVDSSTNKATSKVKTVAKVLSEIPYTPGTKLSAGTFDNYVVVTSSGTLVKSGTKTDSDGYKVVVKSSVIQNIYNTNYDSKTQTDYYEVY